MKQKPYEYFDEEKNLLASQEGVSGGSHLFDNIGFRCSSCMKFYFTPWNLKSHKIRCKINWSEGINKITKKSSKEILEILTELGRLSAGVQRIDFRMTDEDGIKRLNQTVLIYVNKNKILGFINFCKGRFKDKPLIYSLDDFFVMEYVQRGKIDINIGSILFDSMLKEIGIGEKDKKEIEEKVVVCKPSQKMINFLLKKGLTKVREWK